MSFWDNLWNGVKTIFGIGESSYNMSLEERQFHETQKWNQKLFDQAETWNQKSFDQAEKWNQWNADWQQKLFDYNKDLQGQLFAREDNAVQRRVADLRAAGLSPTLAAGSAANAGGTVTQGGSVNARTGSHVQGGSSHALNSPQLDLMSTLMQAQQIGNVAAATKKLQAETENELLRGKNLAADTNLKLQQTATQAAQEILYGNQSQYFGVNALQAQALTDKAYAETDRIMKLNGLTDAEIDKVRAEVDYYRARVSMTEAQTGLIGSEQTLAINKTVYLGNLSAQAKMYTNLLEAQVQSEYANSYMKSMEASFMNTFGTKMPTYSRRDNAIEGQLDRLRSWWFNETPFGKKILSWYGADSYPIR